MLPNSIFSASTLKKTNNLDTPKNDNSKNESSPISKKRQYQYISSDSSSESESESDPELKTSYTPMELQQEINLYSKKLEHQFLKQKIYMEKNKIAARRIRDLNKRLAKLSQIAVDPTRSVSPSSSTVKVKDELEEYEIEDDDVDDIDTSQPLFELQYSSASSSLLKNKPSSASLSKDKSSAPLSKDKSTPSTPPLPSLPLSKENTTVNKKEKKSKKEKSSINNNSKDPNNSIPPINNNIKKSIASSSSTPLSTNDKYSNNINLGKLNYFDRFFSTAEYNDKKSITRKPRSLILNRSGAVTDNYMKELLVSTSLDGELQFINTETRKVIKTLESNILFKDTWIEDLCWASTHTLALAPATKSGQPNNYSISLLDVNLIDRSNIEGNIQQLSHNPHTKPFSVIVPCDINNQNNQSKASFLTAGEDKAVYLWNLKRELPNKQWKEENTTPIKIFHSNRVNALLYDDHLHRIYSGGSDKRFVYYDITAEKQISERRLDTSVFQIVQNRTVPNLILIGESSPEKQFSIYDQRCPKFDSPFKLHFGCKQEAPYSRYVTPDWHENGYTILCGSQTLPKLNFWDIRYNKVSKGPSFEISVEGKTKILPAIFLPTRDTAVSVSSTRVLSWVNYSMERK